MKEAPDGLPDVGPSARTLGARPENDIRMNPARIVLPGTGGISVTPGDPHALPRHRLPTALGGTGKDPLWWIGAEGLGMELTYRPDPAQPTRHGFIEPAREMTFNQYQQALADTRRIWRRYYPMMEEEAL